MLNAGTLTFEEFAAREQLPLATIHDEALEFLRGRDDAVVFGAQALRAFLSDRFHIAVRVRMIGAGKGYRLFQIAKPRNRHLVDIRNAE